MLLYGLFRHLLKNLLCLLRRYLLYFDRSLRGFVYGSGVGVRRSDNVGHIAAQISVGGTLAHHLPGVTTTGHSSTSEHTDAHRCAYHHGGTTIETALAYLTLKLAHLLLAGRASALAIALVVALVRIVADTVSLSYLLAYSPQRPAFLFS